MDAVEGDVAGERPDAWSAEGVPAGRAAARRWLRLGAPAAYLALACAVFVKRGIPLDRGWLILWICGALLALSLTRLDEFVRSFLLEWLPLAGALTLYDVLRGVAGGRFPIWSSPQIWLGEHVFGLGQLPVVWLQARLWRGQPSWYDFVVWAVYASYFVVTPLVLGALWIRARHRFRRYAALLSALAFSALAFFVFVPAIPPWLASEKGLVPPIVGLIRPISWQMPFIDGSSLYEAGVRVANDIAAFPSLHEGMTILVTLFFWRSAGRLVRFVLVLYPLAMGFALVYMGEHYVVDLIGGCLLAALVVRGAEHVERRWRAVYRGDSATSSPPSSS